MKVNHRSPLGSTRIEADGEGLVSRAGTALTVELAHRLGLDAELSGALTHLHSRPPKHAPGRILVDLATMLADGGECLSDLAALANQPTLFGAVASHSTAARLIHALGPGELAALDQARAQTRARAWRAGAGPEQVTLDFDAHLIAVHSEKDGAGPNRKGGFGYHPLLCYLDESGEALAGMLRAGNAGANTAVDHIAVLTDALAQLPEEARGDWRILARSDAAGATHDFAAELRERKLRFSLGYPLSERVGQAALSLPKRRWKAALDADGSAREGAWVAELTGLLDLSAWPEGTRLICRKERPHPGAQLRFSDPEGHRYQCFITDLKTRSLAQLELRHRLHARVEDRIEEGRELGLAKLPFGEFAANEAWLWLALLTQDLLAWLRPLALVGELAKAKPKRLRHRLFHVAGKLTRSGRRQTLHLPRSWPWAGELLAAFARVRALPTPG